jgi:hypothetical protein
MNQDLPPLTTKASDQAPLPALSREMMLFGISLVYGYLDRIETAKSQEQVDTALALVRSQIKGIADQLSTKPIQAATRPQSLPHIRKPTTPRPITDSPEFDRYQRYLDESGAEFALRKMREHINIYRDPALKMKRSGNRKNPYRRIYVQAAWDSRNIVRNCK